MLFSRALRGIQPPILTTSATLLLRVLQEESYGGPRRMQSMQYRLHVSSIAT